MCGFQRTDANDRRTVAKNGNGRRMKRLGRYSGEIYSEEEVAKMQECGLIITDEQSEDEKYLSEKRKENLEHCKICFGCPMSAYRKW